MSGRISIDNLSDSLKEMIANSGSGLSEEQVLNLINENGLSEEQVINLIKNNLTGDLTQLNTANKTNIVAAINELFQNANNGKELIANAIGEPLNSNDTFSAMSNDINGLLSTFKTNMMNNGVTVNSSDKFKQLIDKIATLADSEGKGIQHASGQIDAGSYKFTNVNSTHAFSFNEPLNFTPTYLFIRIPYVRYSSTNGSGDSRNAIVSNLFNDIYDGTDWAKQLRVGCISSEGILNIKSVSSSGFVMEGDTNLTFGYSSSTGYDSDYYIDWYAFGVGEEDTTLRDSLASILEEEGVIVTEEDDMASLITKVDSEFTKDNNNISGLESDISNGKSIIANAIGTPLTSTDTFTEMGSDINGLLSTFKTNMMKNGVTVNSGDKFKALIDKIATLADNEGGLQYATGQGTPTSIRPFIDVIGGSLNLYYLQVNNLTFKPSTILLGYSDPTYGDYTTFYSEELASDRVTLVNTKRDNITLGTLDNVVKSSSCTINSTGFILPVSMAKNYTWIAIGVGEEDTTLRDSLASILQGEGVEVTEEDDMVNLITKVDEEFDRKNTEMENSGGLDIISATTLPATGKENQICVITDNPVNNFIMTGNSAESDNDKIVIYNSTGNSNYNAVKNNITYSYNISRVQYQSNNLSSYYWGNNQWNQLTFGSTVLFKNGKFLSTDLTGGFGTGEGVSISGSEFAFVGGRDVSLISTTRKQINFSNFKTLKVTMYTNNSNTFIVGSFMNTYSGKQSSTFNTTGKTYNIYRLTPLTTETEMSIDISDWTTGYLGFFRAAQSVAPSIYITKITLE